MNVDTLSRSIFHINASEPRAAVRLGCILAHLLSGHDFSNRDMTLLCIGSDRIIGDSLGPIIGHRLSRLPQHRLHIFGTLQRPVHALNLNETLEHIRRLDSNPFLIAIDASLGSKKHQGYVTVGAGPLQPGAGVNKSLGAVGDIFITGITNTAGAFGHLLLQSTRLSTVMTLAECISDGILLAHSCIRQDN